MALSVTELQRLMREHAEETGHDINHPKMVTSAHGLLLPATGREFIIHTDEDSPNNYYTYSSSAHPLENKIMASIGSINNDEYSDEAKKELTLHPYFPTLNNNTGNWDYDFQHPTFREGVTGSDVGLIHFPSNQKQLQDSLRYLSSFPHPIATKYQPGNPRRVATPEEAANFHKNVTNAELLHNMLPWSHRSLEYYTGVDHHTANPHEFISVHDYGLKNKEDQGDYVYHPGTEQLFTRRQAYQ